MASHPHAQPCTPHRSKLPVRDEKSTPTQRNPATPSRTAELRSPTPNAGHDADTPQSSLHRCGPVTPEPEPPSPSRHSVCHKLIPQSRPKSSISGVPSLASGSRSPSPSKGHQPAVPLSPSKKAASLRPRSPDAKVLRSAVCDSAAPPVLQPGSPSHAQAPQHSTLR